MHLHSTRIPTVWWRWSLSGRTCVYGKNCLTKICIGCTLRALCSKV